MAGRAVLGRFDGLAVISADSGGRACAVAFKVRIWHSCAPCRRAIAGFGCGCSSGVEHDLAKVGVEGSNPFARSRFFANMQVGYLGLPFGGICFSEICANSITMPR